MVQVAELQPASKDTARVQLGAACAVFTLQVAELQPSRRPRTRILAVLVHDGLCRGAGAEFFSFFCPQRAVFVMSKLTRAGKKGLADAISSFFVQSDVKMSYAQSERLAEHIKQHMADSLRTTGVFGLRDFGQLSVVCVREEAGLFCVVARARARTCEGGVSMGRGWLACCPAVLSDCTHPCAQRTWLAPLPQPQGAPNTSAEAALLTLEQTKEPIEVPACKTVKFKISRSFKSTLQDKEYD